MSDSVDNLEEPHAPSYSIVDLLHNLYMQASQLLSGKTAIYTLDSDAFNPKQKEVAATLSKEMILDEGEEVAAQFTAQVAMRSHELTVQPFQPSKKGIHNRLTNHDDTGCVWAIPFSCEGIIAALVVINDSLYPNEQDQRIAMRLIHESATISIKNHDDKSRILEAILDSIPDTIVVKDKEGKWILTNRAIREKYHLDDTAYAGKNSREVLESQQIKTPFVDFGAMTDELAFQNGSVCYSTVDDVSKPDPQYLSVYKTIVPLSCGKRQLLTISRDITEIHDSHSRLRNSLREFRGLFEHANDAMYLYPLLADGGTGTFANVNQVARERLGYSKEELACMTVWDITEKSCVQTVKDGIAKLLSDHHVIAEVTHVCKDGSHIPMEISGQLFVNSGERWIVTIARDITQRKLTRAELEKRTYFDDLTGLPNVRWLTDHVRTLVDRINRRDPSISQDPVAMQMALVTIHINDFQQIIDSFGRDLADEVVKQVSLRIKASLPGDCEIGRLSPDEWLIVMAHLQSAEQYQNVAQAIRDQLNREFIIGGLDIIVAPNIGVCVYPTLVDSNARDAETLIRQASMASHAVRKGSRTQIECFHPDMEASMRSRRTMHTSLREAIGASQFFCEYQPRFNLQRKMVGMEALVRWHHPDRGIVMPSEFIEIAEDTGLILPLGEQVLRLACQQAKVWLNETKSHFKVAVNVSVKQLEQRDFADIVLQILDETGLNPEDLELEVTESCLMDGDTGIDHLHFLKQRGVTISIDDFGTGYSSLQYLHQLPIHALKIDRSFVQAYDGHGSQSTKIVHAIIHLAHHLGLSVVGEGIETPAQLSWLSRLRCDEMQGFWLGRPTRASKFSTFFPLL